MGQLKEQILKEALGEEALEQLRQYQQYQQEQERLMIAAVKFAMSNSKEFMDYLMKNYPEVHEWYVRDVLTH